MSSESPVSAVRSGLERVQSAFTTGGASLFAPRHAQEQLGGAELAIGGAIGGGEAAGLIGAGAGTAGTAAETAAGATAGGAADVGTTVATEPDIFLGESAAVPAADVGATTAADTGAATAADLAPLEEPPGTPVDMTGMPAALQEPAYSAAPYTTPTPTTMQTALRAAPLALSVLGTGVNVAMARRQAEQLKQIGGPQRALGEQLLSQYQSGTLNPADTAAIDQWKTAALAQSRQYFAKAGLSDSSAAKTAEDQINKQAVDMASQAREKLLTTALNALQVSDPFQAQAIRAEFSGDQAAIQGVSNFLNTYGQWMRMQPTMTGTAPATTGP